MPKFEVSAVDEDEIRKSNESTPNRNNQNHNQNRNQNQNDNDDDDEQRGQIIAIKSIDDAADSSAVSPFIVSLPSDEGVYIHIILFVYISIHLENIPCFFGFSSFVSSYVF